MNWYKKSTSERDRRDDIFKNDKGEIRVWPNSPHAPDNRNSISEWVVDEEHRGKGVGTELADQMLKSYEGKPMSAQVSSLASLKILHNKGFRNPDVGEATFEEYIKHFKENWGSLYMRLN